MSLIRLLLTTVMRPHECFSLHWEYDGWDTEKNLSKAVITFNRKVIFIPQMLTKNHKDREVPLSPELLAMFREMPRDPNSTKVFPWSESLKLSMRRWKQRHQADHPLLPLRQPE